VDQGGGPGRGHVFDTCEGQKHRYLMNELSEGKERARMTPDASLSHREDGVESCYLDEVWRKGINSEKSLSIHMGTSGTAGHRCVCEGRGSSCSMTIHTGVTGWPQGTKERDNYRWRGGRTHVISDLLNSSFALFINSNIYLDCIWIFSINISSLLWIVTYVLYNYYLTIILLMKRTCMLLYTA
jgi:hypothetical protein